jgi:phosphatidylinositol alpha-1,6-mannosyltransferase
MTQALLITSDFPPTFGGGISRYYHCLCQYSENKIAVLAPQCGETRLFDESQPFPIFRHRVPLGRALPLRFLQTLLLGLHGVRLARRTGARVILFGHWYLAMVGSIIHRLWGFPFYVFLYGGELDRFAGSPAIMRAVVAALDQAQTIIVISEYTRQDYVCKKGGRNQRIVKISPGVDARRFAPGADYSFIVSRHGLEGKRVLLTVSRLVERKGHDVVIRALPQILESVPDTVYLIVGSGPMEQTLKTLCQEVGVSDRVIFAGPVADEELPAYYNACDVFVMPSRQFEGREGVEGFGIVFLEASACAKPVIGGRSGGVNEAITDGVSGLLVDPLDVKALADAVVGLLLDPDRTRRLGMQGRKRVEQEFDWRIQAEKLRDLLDVL